MKTKDLSTTVYTGSTISPVERIIQAIGQGQSLENVGKLLDYEKQWHDEQAKREFYKDFAAAQAEIGHVVKTKTNAQTHSKYADLSDVIDCAKPVYTKYGFAVIFHEGVTPVAEHVRICADVLHSKGHKEPFFLDVPMDGMGIKGNANMTKIHGKASSTAYGRRYLMCMIWNIPTADDDGNAAGNKADVCITWEEEEKLTKLLQDRGLTLKNLLKYMKVESLGQIKANEYKKAEAGILAAHKEAK